MMNKLKTLNSIFLLPAIAGLLVACTFTPSAVQAPQRPACESAYALPDNIVSQKIITIGEIHGTTEIPAAVGQLACSFLKQGKQVMVGLELDNDALPAMLKYQASAKTATDIAALRQSRFWDKGLDGRASMAMANLIVQLNLLKSQGYPIDMMAFDYTLVPVESQLKLSNNESSILRDQNMAINVKRALLAAPDRMFILFAGNFHSSKQKTLTGVPDWRSMAHILSQQYPLVSFNTSFLDGTAWVCLRTGCGANQMRGFASNPGAPFIRIDDNSKAPNFPAYSPAHDGTLFIGGKITASPPFIHSLQ
jgi:hypothetical protein